MNDIGSQKLPSFIFSSTKKAFFSPNMDKLAVGGVGGVGVLSTFYELILRLKYCKEITAATMNQARRIFLTLWTSPSLTYPSTPGEGRGERGGGRRQTCERFEGRPAAESRGGGRRALCWLGEQDARTQAAPTPSRAGVVLAPPLPV